MTNTVKTIALIDMTGEKYSRLMVMEFSGKQGRKTLWKCICDCGNEKIVRSDSLKDGSVKSCGCLNNEKRKERSTVHGWCGTPEYTSWQSMKSRCYTKSNCEYKNYGGRGISVCDRWVASFINFIDDMGVKPSSSYSIERIDNNGNYEPSNCKWASKTEQSRNIRVRKTNKLGIRGVCKGKNRWTSYIGVDNKNIHLGRFNDFFEACCARKSAENKYW